MKKRIENITIICQKYSVKELYSFGSRGKEILQYVNDTISVISDSSSDADIGVRYMPGFYPSAELKIKLSFELEDFFSFNKVDLVLLEDSSPFLALDIIRGEILYAANLDDQANYELYVMGRAGDLMFYEKQRRKSILSVRKV